MRKLVESLWLPILQLGHMFHHNQLLLLDYILLLPIVPYSLLCFHVHLTYLCTPIFLQLLALNYFLVLDPRLHFVKLIQFFLHCLNPIFIL